MAPKLIREIVARHADEVGELSSLRGKFVAKAATSVSEIVAFDDRLDANLEGLRIAGPMGWDAAVSALAQPADGAFAATVVALESGSMERLGPVLDLLESAPPARAAVLFGLEWVSAECALPAVRQLLASPVPARRAVGVCAATAHAIGSENALTAALGVDDSYLRAAAVGCAGRARRHDVLLAVAKAYADPVPAVRFRAGWSGLLLGDLNALSILDDEVSRQGAFADEAVGLVVRVIEPTRAASWIERQRGPGGSLRASVLGAGGIGDPALVPFLLDAMDAPALARAAADAFDAITGIDITRAGLTVPAPDGPPTGPSDDPARDDVAPDPDDGLPWPRVDAFRAWWKDNSERFRAGTRYVLGAPLGRESLVQALMRGRQRLRRGVAIELAVLHSKAPLFDVTAPAARQRTIN